MKRYVIAVLVVLSIATCAVAQTNVNPTPRPVATTNKSAFKREFNKLFSWAKRKAKDPVVQAKAKRMAIAQYNKWKKKKGKKRPTR